MLKHAEYENYDPLLLAFVQRHKNLANLQYISPCEKYKEIDHIILTQQ